MFFHAIKKNSELEKELMEKDKQEILNYTISIRNELMKCYEKIYDLDREHRKSKNLFVYIEIGFNIEDCPNHFIQFFLI